ncbi:hypothetical protein AAVH_23822 [Aphelenchoides avenae]|nr:hypothetical protein AAVH_23822 [Aphelenchus avenae]
MRPPWFYLALTTFIVLQQGTSYSQETTCGPHQTANAVSHKITGAESNDRPLRLKRGGVFGSLKDKARKELERLKEKAKEEGKRIENRLKDARDNFKTDLSELTAEKTVLKLKEQEHAYAEAEKARRGQEQAGQRLKEAEQEAQKATTSSPVSYSPVPVPTSHIDRPSAESDMSLFGIALIALPSAVALLAFIVLVIVLYRRRHKRTAKSYLRGLPIVVDRPGVGVCKERLPIRIGETDNAASDCGVSSSYAIPTSLDCRFIPESELDVFWSGLIGEGHFASVHEAIRRSTHDKVVIKVLHPDKRHIEEYRSDMWQEIMLMYNISGHRHILRILGHTFVFDTPVPVLECCKGGDLRTYLRRKLKGQSEIAVTVGLGENENIRLGVDFTPTLADLMSFCWQICDGMVYLSSKGFIHRDLAARNILLDERLIVKIADFGLCRYLNHDYYSANRDKEVPIRCSAPEALKRAHFTFESDV